MPARAAEWGRNMPMNAYNRYQEQSVMTMTSGEMLMKLYDETIKQLQAGKRFIEAKDMQQAEKALQKAQTILEYLRSTLNRKYPISANLSSLYRFFKEQIMSAIIRRDVKPLDDITPMVEELRDAFAQADKQVRMGKQHPTELVG